MQYLLSKKNKKVDIVTESRAICGWVCMGGCTATCSHGCRYDCGGCWANSCVGHCSSFCGRLSW